MPPPATPPSGGPTLASLATHRNARITAIREDGGTAVAEHVQRLMELGFLPGEPVRVVATGYPAGDPIAVRIGKATFALRRFEAALIEVAPDPAP